MANPSPFVFIACAIAATACLAQTPAQMEYERQQREYWRQQEQQRQEQQRQQQLMQDNARRQQEESSRINTPSGGGSAGGTGGGGRGQAADPSNAAAWSAARATWEKRPPLAPADNPLLGGRWSRPADPAAKSSDPFAGLTALAKGGMCEALFGGGMFEFRANSLVGMDSRTPEMELDKVEYRGGGKHIVVLPKTTVKLIEFDLETPDRIRWTAQPNCVLVRVKSDSMRAATANPAAPSPSTAAAPASKNAGGALSVSVGENKVAGRQLLVLKEDAQVALIKGGITNTPNGTVLQTWMRACAAHTADCQRGLQALKPVTLGYITTDATGVAHSPPLPSGRYWLLADTKLGDKRVMWNQPVDVHSGDNAVTLDRRNAMPVD